MDNEAEGGPGEAAQVSKRALSGKHEDPGSIPTTQRMLSAQGRRLPGGTQRRYSVIKLARYI